MKKYLIYFTFFLLIVSPAFAETSLSERLKGRILLNTQENGETWYVRPSNLKRYFLGRPSDAFEILKTLGTGISNIDLNKIPTGVVEGNEVDTDKDGLSDNLEIALGTNINKIDSDDDGFNDKLEIDNNYNPNGKGIISIDNEFTNKQLGKIFLQTEKNGEAWYIDPVSQKKYYLSRPSVAFKIMRQFGLGISVKNLAQINVKQILRSQPPIIPPIVTDEKKVIDAVASAIRSKDIKKTQNLFIPELNISLEYSLNNMTNESVLVLANLLSGSFLDSSSPSKLVYKNTVFFNGENHDIYFNVEKQENGTWLMTNL